MDLRAFDQISPFVRMMRIKSAASLRGEWQDIDHVFTLVSAGSGDFILDGMRCTLKRGDIIVIPSYHAHVILSSGPEPLVQKIMHFDFFEDPDRAGLLHQDVLSQDTPKVSPPRERLLGEQPFLTTLPDEAAIERFEALYDRTYAEFRAMCAGEGCAALLRAYATELLMETFRCGQSGPVAREIENVRSKAWLHVENAMAFINEHLNDDDLSNERISAAVGVSPNYLTKRFCAYFGMPLHRYVTCQRIEKARQLLLHGSGNITEVAALTGFSSIHVFSKTFKNVLGCTPSAYLEELADEKAVMRVCREPWLIERRVNAMQKTQQKEEDIH